MLNAAKLHFSRIEADKKQNVIPLNVLIFHNFNCKVLWASLRLIEHKLGNEIFSH